MKIQITARHDRKVSDETKNFIEGEVADLNKFYENINSIQVVLDKETHASGNVDLVDIIVDTDNKKQLVGKASEENLGKAFDKAKEKVVSQLKKLNDIRKSHGSTPVSELTGEFTEEITEEK